MAIVPRNSSITTLQSAVSAAANGATMDTTEGRAVVLEISGTFTGITANFEASIDGGTSWFAVALQQLSASTPTYTAAATAAGLYQLKDSHGINAMRARTTVSTPTGSMTVRGVFAIQ